MTTLKILCINTLPIAYQFKIEYKLKNITKLQEGGKKMSKRRPPRKKEVLDLASTTVKILKKTDSPLTLNFLFEKINSLPEVKTAVSLSALHNELNFDGRFVFIKGQGWLLKTQVPDLKRDYDDFDILEKNYLPTQNISLWTTNDDDDNIEDKDDDELLVPFDDELDIDIEEIDEIDEDLEEDYDSIDDLEDLEDFEDLDEYEDLDEVEEDDYEDPIF